MTRSDVFGAARRERINRLTLNPNVEKLLNRCGKWADLVLDTLLVADDVRGFSGPGLQGFIASQEVGVAISWLLDEPLMSAMLDVTDAAAARCRHCQPREPLKIVSMNGSGSSAEGLGDGRVGFGGASDFDMMLELDGPFHWSAVGTAAEPARIDPQDAPQLWARPTSNAGFVTLHWVRTTQCSHETVLDALPADSTRQTMLNLHQVMQSGKIETPGPAVNVRSSSDVTDGGMDFVPCLRVPGWWPAEDQLADRHRKVDFPPAAALDDIRRFGVHLVPTGRPGSATEKIEWRISFSRAEIIAVRHLKPVQHATITALKGIKNMLKDSNVTNDGLKSYFLKTAGLWLAQKETWSSITDGTYHTLDWLEKHLNTGTLPCFFYDAINVAAELSLDQRWAIIRNIRLMRKHATRLLLAYCDKLWDLDILLEGGTGPLSERQVRLRLGRTLVRQAVLEGVRFRPSAPCWKIWWKRTIRSLARAAKQLMIWYHHDNSGTNYQQCLLLSAWAVLDPVDLASGIQVRSPPGDIVTLDVSPLMAILTMSDLQFLLAKPAAVADWCHRQLQRPPAERPAGLTAELDTPRGRADLLLQPELLLRVLKVTVPLELTPWWGTDLLEKKRWAGNYRPLKAYQKCCEVLERLLNSNLHHRLRDKLPDLDGRTVAAMADLWRRRIQYRLSGDQLRRDYDAAISQWPDRWELLQYCVVVDDTNTQGKICHTAPYTQTHEYSCGIL